MGSGERVVRPTTVAVSPPAPGAPVRAISSPTATPVRSAVPVSRVTPRASSAAGNAPSVRVTGSRDTSPGTGRRVAVNSVPPALPPAHVNWVA